MYQDQKAPNLNPRIDDFVRFLVTDLTKGVSIEAELHAICNKEDFIRRSVELAGENEDENGNFEFTEQELEDWLDNLEEEKKKESKNPNAVITYPIKDMGEIEHAIYAVSFY